MRTRRRFALATPARSGPVAIWLFSATLAVIAAGLAMLTDLRGHPHAGSFHAPWWALLVMFHLTEAHVVHVQFRRDSESFSLSEIPLVLGLFFASPWTVLWTQMAGSASALVFRRKQPPVKLAFNLTHLMLDTTIAVAVFDAVARRGHGLLSMREGIGAFLATGAAIVVGVLSVVIVISLAEGRLQTKMLPRVLGLGLIGTITNTSLALVGVSTIRTQSSAGWMLIVPAVTLMFAYRAYNRQRQQHTTLEQLNEAARAVQLSREIEPAMMALLERARTMFRADAAWITLLPVGDAPAMRTMLGPGDRVDVMMPVELDPTEGIWARVCSEEIGVLLPRPIRSDRLREYFAAMDIRDVMAIPIHAEQRVVGLMAVGNRLGDVSTFTHEDLKLFETLGNHASVSLENARLVSQLQESLVRLTELNRMKDEFVATVSHELRTPLTSIAGSVKTIMRLEGTDRAQDRQFLEIIDRQSERLRMLIEDLLLVSKIESQVLQPLPERVDVRPMIERVTEMFTTRLGQRRLVLEIEDKLPPLYADEESLHRILTNLVDNAIKYAPDGTPIEIGARLDHDAIQLWVEDQGYGVDAEQKDAIFERFYQADQSLTRRVGGAGLGLYICRKLAERIGAHLWLDSSAPGEGSRFCLRVARAPVEVTDIRSHRTA